MRRMYYLQGAVGALPNAPEREEGRCPTHLGAEFAREVGALLCVKIGAWAATNITAYDTWKQ